MAIRYGVYPLKRPPEQFPVKVWKLLKEASGVNNENKKVA